MNSPPLVAIVLLNYNGRNYLEQHLPFLLQTTYSHKKIFVIDNASSDDSLAFLETCYPEITILRQQQNKGYAGGYNDGLKSIEADYYILINTDVKVTPGFIEPLIATLEKNPGAAICQPKILSLEHPQQFEYAGAGGGFIDKYGYTFARGRILDHYETDNGQYNHDCEIFWAGGACFAIKASVFHELHGFYEYFFMYYEEVDICWRAQLSGYKVFYCHASVVYHKETNQFIRQPAYRIYYVFRNNFIALLRHLPWHSKILLVPARILLNFAASLLFLIKGYPAKSFMVIKSLGAVLYWVISAPRQKIRNRQPFTRLKGVYKKSILASYYLKKIRNFSSLNQHDFT